MAEFKNAGKTKGAARKIGSVVGRKPSLQYPYKKLVLPSALAGQKNGRLHPELLAKIKCGGQMWGGAARAFNAMYDHAKRDGIVLKNIGDYRPYERILAMFHDRYAPTQTGRKPEVTRKFDGRVWYLKKGKAPSAAPDPSGKTGSNHGWGLAIDLDVTNGKTLRWLCTNAPTYGFYLQGSDPKSPEFESWHWQFVLGDKSPAILGG